MRNTSNGQAALFRFDARSESRRWSSAMMAFGDDDDEGEKSG